jgi:hypothetical protein
LIQTVKREAN